MMKAALSSPMLAQALREIRANVRLRLGLAIVAGLLGIQVLLMLDEWAMNGRESLNSARTQVEQLQAVISDKGWAERRQKAIAQRDSLERRLWNAETEGLAMASFQDWLVTVTQQSGIDQLRMQVGVNPDASAPEGMKVFTATLRMSAEVDALDRLLTSLATAERLVAVEKLNIQRVPVPQADMVLTAWYRPKAGAKP